MCIQKVSHLYVENPKQATSTSRKLLAITNEFIKVTGYKIDLQKSIVILYTGNERSENEILEAIPFTIAPKQNKILQDKLNKKVQDLYTKD